MLNLPPIKPTLIKDVEDKSLSLSERVIYWTIVLTPVWWLAGIQPLFYPSVVTGLLAIHFRLNRLIEKPFLAFVWAWLAMSIVMLWTAFLGLNDMEANVLQILAAVLTFFKSYFLIFACLALPFYNQVRPQVVTRAIAWMASSYLVTITVQFAMLAIKIGGTGFLPPLARLIPGDKGSLRVDFATPSSFLGLPIPRTVLYTPDPPILGMCALLCFLICLHESNPRLKQLALFGSFSALIVSASRSALILLPLALLLSICFQSKFSQQASLWLASLSLLCCSVLGLTINELLEKPSDFFNTARSNAADSTLERALVVKKTLEAWQESPWIGWGVIQGSVNLYEDTRITLGSFSTYAAVLYLHGIFGAAALITAMVLTLWHTYRLASQGYKACNLAFAGLVTLYIALNATPLSWMAVNLWFFFVWLGAVLYVSEEDLI